MRFSKTRHLLVLAAIAVSGSAVLAAEPAKVKLGGSVYLDAETCAKGTTSPDCQLIFEITGKSAKAIYDGMAGKGEMQECTGEVEKFDESGMHCIKGKTAADYLCDFGYNFKKAEFGGGGDGC